MKTLSDWAWSRGFRWSSSRKLPYFEMDHRSGLLDDAGLLNYAMLLCDLGCPQRAEVLLGSMSPEKNSALPCVQWYCCKALHTLLLSRPDRAKHLDSLAYAASLGDSKKSDYVMHAVEPFLTQLLLRSEAGALSRKDLDLLIAWSKIIETLTEVSALQQDTRINAFRLHVAIGEGDLALRKIKNEVFEGRNNEASLAMVAYDLWVRGETKAAKDVCNELPEHPTGVPETDCRRAIAAAVNGFHNIAYYSYKSVLEAGGYALIPTRIMDWIHIMLILKSLNSLNKLKINLHNTYQQNDFISFRMHLVERLKHSDGFFVFNTCSIV